MAPTASDREVLRAPDQRTAVAGTANNVTVPGTHRDLAMLAVTDGMAGAYRHGGRVHQGGMLGQGTPTGVDAWRGAPGRSSSCGRGGVDTIRPGMTTHQTFRSSGVSRIEHSTSRARRAVAASPRGTQRLDPVSTTEGAAMAGQAYYSNTTTSTAGSGVH
jgi:hypothetical protein